MSEMKLFMAVAIGGGIGASLRYGLVALMAARFGHGFPWGTLCVNVLGSLLIGVAYVVLVERFAALQWMRLVLITGLLGGFTTFSAFSLDTLMLLESGLWIRGMIYSILTVALCLASTLFGLWLTRVFMKSIV